jgi:type VI secretion system secreted protein VgrG
VTTQKVHYSLTCNAPESVSWQVRQVNLQEKISEPYRAHITVRLEAPPDRRLVGASCVLSIYRGAALSRRLCGIVHGIECAHSPNGILECLLHVGPALLALEHRTDARTFVDQTAVEILTEVLSGPLAAYQRTCKFCLTARYPKREFVVQYNESDADFAHRLMAEAGINYFFTHDGAAECLVLTDENASFPVLGSNAATCHYTPDASEHTESITAFIRGQGQVATAVTVQHYDWTRPNTPIGNHKSDKDAHGRDREAYRYQDAGLHAYTTNAYTADSSARQVTLEKQRLAIVAQSGTCGTSTCSHFLPGHVFTLAGHPVTGYNQKYILTAVSHAADVRYSHTRGPNPGPEAPVYSNTFSCIAYDTECRPRQKPAPKQIVGIQTATVVGPDGEEIWTDAHGRVKVRFAWDRRESNHTQSSCWVRVLQSWAGTAFGALQLPRVGMEVLVTFVDGDATAPLVIGCAYNGANIPPYALPEHKSRTVLRTRTTPQSDGFNEMFFEDAAGEEEIHLRAERDLRFQVNRDQDIAIGGDARLSAAHNYTIDIGEACTVKVGAEQNTHIQGREIHTVEEDRELHIAGDTSIDIGGDQSTEVQGNADLTVLGSLHVTVDAETDLSIGKGLDSVIEGPITLAGHRGMTTVIQKECTFTAESIGLSAHDACQLSQGKASIALKDGNVHISAQKIFLNGKDITIDATGILVTSAAKTNIN